MANQQRIIEHENTVLALEPTLKEISEGLAANIRAEGLTDDVNKCDCYGTLADNLARLGYRMLALSRQIHAARRGRPMSEGNGLPLIEHGRRPFPENGRIVNCIRQLDYEMREQFGVDYAFNILGRGLTIAESSRGGRKIP